jgi:hypothetical protein
VSLPPVPTSYRTLGLTCSVAEAIDPVKWRERYAWGVNLGGSMDLKAALRRCGADPAAFERFVDAIPTRVISWHLRSALSELEIKLGIPMGIRRFKCTPLDEGVEHGRDYDVLTEPIAYTPNAAQNYLRFDLTPSVISVERIRGVLFGNVVYEWEQGGTDARIEIVDHVRGEVRVFLQPSATTIAPSAIPALAPALGYGRTVPGFWRVDYTCGPWAKYEGRDEPGRIELALADWIGLNAGVKLLSLAGTAAGGGIASGSLSIDGLSKSFGTTASAMYGLNSALEAVYKEHKDAIDWKSLRAYKNPMRVLPMNTRSQA